MFFHKVFQRLKSKNNFQNCNLKPNSDSKMEASLNKDPQNLSHAQNQGMLMILKCLYLIQHILIELFDHKFLL